MRPTITAHMVVKNEDQWVEYAIRSVLPFVDSFLITDTGSTDHTVSKISSIRDSKIKFSHVDTTNIVAIRNQQLSQTHTDWLWMVDGDEIYPQKTTQEILDALNANLAGVIVRRFDCLGDVYHYQPNEQVGAYHLAGKTGHYNLRLINCTTPGLHLKGDYPLEGFYDGNNQAVVDYKPSCFYVTANRYLHTTYLVRSSQGGNLANTKHRHKYKIEWGKPLPQAELPEVLAKALPPKRSLGYIMKAALITPIKLLKRRLMK